MPISVYSYGKMALLTVSRKNILLALFALLCSTVFSQNSNLDKIQAQSEFRWGVQAYHAGLYLESVRSLEKSMTFNPEDPLAQFWLGLAYFRAGLDSNSISLWKNLIDRGEGSAFIQNCVEILEARTGLERELSDGGRYVEAYAIQGKTKEYNAFQRPGGIFAANDGGFFLTSYVSNEVLRFNANGQIKDRIIGGFAGFNRPFDLIMAENGYLYISEFAGNNIARCKSDGSDFSRFGESGIGPGQFLGPQFLATDGKGYLYVTDIGNRIIHKYDLEGKFLFDFGKKTAFCPGLIKPTGIACLNDLIYTADAGRNEIMVFDDSGNYLTSLGSGFLNHPEGLTIGTDDTIIIADTDRIVRLYPESEKIELVGDFTNSAGKITKAVFDENRHLLTSDFNLNKVSILTEFANMYAGLHVQTMAVNAENFPTIRVEVAVMDRLGKPFTGLEEKNFFITDDAVPPDKIDIIHSADKDKTLSLALLADRSIAASGMKEEAKEAASTVYGFINGKGTISMVSASELPTLELSKTPKYKEFTEAAANNGRYSDAWSIDSGILLAGSELMNTPGKRALFLTFAGDLGRKAFQTYGLTETAQYLKNNGIKFYCIYLKDPNFIYSSELEYICAETGGESAYLYQAEGLDNIAERLNESKTGRYVIEYQSSAYTDFGQRYIPLSIEAHIYARSGRDETGYFAPLEF